jgi:two-component system cell cycle sensor histidine kinase/response regulator CckA
VKVLMPQLSGDQRPYPWLPMLIIVMTAVALGIGVFVLYYVESRLVATTGESLALAAADIADKLDRLLFERYGDVQMMARAFGLRSRDTRYMTTYLTWMKKSYPVYLWLGVTDARGVVIAATSPDTVGQDHSQELWFQTARSGRVHVGDVEPYEVAGGVDSVAFTAPMYGPSGEFVGVVTTRVGLPPLEDVVTRTIQAFRAREGFLGTVEYQFLTSTGQAFVDSDLLHKGNINLRKMGLRSALLAESSEPGYLEEQHLRRSVTVVTGYARTLGRGDFASLRWGVLVRVDRNDILAPIRSVLLRLVIAGAVVWVPMFAVLLWATGRLRKEWGQARQESERAKAAEATLREQNERFELVSRATNDWIWDWNVVTNDIWWNDSLEVLFGYQARDIKPSFEFWYDRIHPDEREKIVASQFATLDAGRRFWSGEYRFRRADDTYAEVIDRAHALYDENGKAIRMIGSVRDITDRKLAEKRQAAQLAVNLVLAESATLAESAPKLLQAVCDTSGWELGGIWLVDRTAKVLRCETVWSDPAVKVEEFVALSRERTFTSGIGLPGRVWDTGQPAWIPDVVKDPNFPRAPIAAKVGLHAAFGFPILLGREVLGVLEFFSHEIRQPDRDLLAMMADIGVKLGQFIERRQLEGQLRQSQKMEAVGQLAGGIAHDFNNVLTVITGYSQLLLARVGPGNPLCGELEEIRKAGDRAAALTRQLLAFSRRQVLAPKVLNLNDVLASIEGMVRRLIGEDMEMMTILYPSLGLVKADPGQIEQVIVNLAVNARDAMPQGGKLTIETANVVLDEIRTSKQVTIPAGLYVMLAVSDTGHGMDSGTQAHIFEPFFTTKEKGKGTGLGLATVYGIVKQSDGYITVYSEPGRGAAFKIYLPQAEAVAEPSERKIPLRTLDGSETLLVVEDEDTIRSLACSVLQSHGYTVLEALNAKDALRLSQEQSGPIHLLLTDVVMPQTSGRELAERMTVLRPDMKVLFMSGYTDDAVVRHGVLREGTAFLQKPFAPADLARKVREVLDASHGAPLDGAAA